MRQNDRQTERETDRKRVKQKGGRGEREKNDEENKRTFQDDMKTVQVVHKRYLYRSMLTPDSNTEVNTGALGQAYRFSVVQYSGCAKVMTPMALIWLNSKMAFTIRGIYRGDP